MEIKPAHRDFQVKKISNYFLWDKLPNTEEKYAVYIIIQICNTGLVKAMNNMTHQSNNYTNIEPGKVLFYGRTLQEYIKMFALELSKYEGCKVLDCPAGPASFVEEARQQGLDAIGCDPFYTDEIELLIEHGKFGIDKTVEFCFNYSQLSSQKFYSSIEAMKEYATTALKIFTDSYPVGRKHNRYVQAALPNLPFDNKSFDLVLSGNFLFVYSNLSHKKLEYLDYQFHYQAVLELLRVSKGEVRIFPIPSFGEQLNEYALRLLDDLEKEKIMAHLIPVEYELIQGSNLMLSLTL